MQEIIRNTRILARYLVGKTSKLVFDLQPIEVVRNDTLFAKELLLGKTARQLNMNKSTHWYQKKRLIDYGSIRLYSKSRQYFFNHQTKSQS